MKIKLEDLKVTKFGELSKSILFRLLDKEDGSGEAVYMKIRTNAEDTHGRTRANALDVISGKAIHVDEEENVCTVRGVIVEEGEDED